MHAFFQHCFYLANAGRYREKQDFYRLKAQLLKYFGRYDGWDLQVLTDDCWDCYGNDPSCTRCDGNGIYSIRRFYLERWILDNRTYHKPVPETPYGDYREVLTQKITHEPIPYRRARIAAYILFARYWPRLLVKKSWQFTKNRLPKWRQPWWEEDEIPF